MFENVDGRTLDGRRTDDGRTDAGFTGILISHLGDFGLGKQKRLEMDSIIANTASPWF